MIYKPNEVKSLKKGQSINVEINEALMVLRRNFCGVYELYSQKNQRHVEYFDNLNFFKIRYADLNKKFPLVNLSMQRLEIFSISKKIPKESLLKWFNEYGKIIHENTKYLDGIKIEYYIWISETDGSASRFNIAEFDDEYTLNIPAKIARKAS
ncbi:hypothetical protein ABG79_01841 [Caloramator mitchellensis]|uniref:Uncharacterized protein n=1 Tax=Caloramator mitchellensis TaxID=908809 RepID=A0A0R3JS70_CALMK|nr:hypothetical protein [Caloramator mitchellensis]KRQ86329.1 hypothetical protein ABG79_01841 [Caloramator mitchellensis]